MKPQPKIFRIGIIMLILAGQFLVYASSAQAQIVPIPGTPTGGPILQANSQPPAPNANNAAAPDPKNPQAQYTGRGVEASIRALLCAPSEASNANVTRDSSLTLRTDATVVDNPAGNDLTNCINKGYRFALAFGAVAAIFFVVLAGYMYMVGGEHGKTKAKEVIVSVLVGFLIMLSSFVLLRQINPTLTTFRTIQPPKLAGTYSLPDCAEVDLGADCVLPGGIPAVGNGQGGGRPKGSGSCKPVHNPASGCDVDKLKGVCNWDAEAASGTCSAESAGGMDPAIGGQSDKCYIDGPNSAPIPMSYGYFQIALTTGSHQPEFNAECDGVVVDAGKDECYEWKTLPKTGKKYCKKRKCSLPKGRAAFDACVRAVTDTARHYKQACNLYHGPPSPNTFRDWYAAHECKYYP